MSKDLNVDENFCLLFVPHPSDMSIYQPEQLFKKDQNLEKISNVVAKKIINALPSSYEGGNLIIEHNKQKHRDFGSRIPEIIKCVAFYSNCNYKVTKVYKGFRVISTYNIKLQYHSLLKKYFPQIDLW